MKSLRKAAVSDFRDVIETQVQRFQGNVGLQLTCFNAADPVVMPETVRRRNGDNLVLLEKQKEYLRPQQAHRLAPEFIRSDLRCFFNSCRGETHTRETFLNPHAVPMARETNSQIFASFQMLFLVWYKTLPFYGTIDSIHHLFFQSFGLGLLQACTSRTDLLHARTARLDFNPAGKEC